MNINLIDKTAKLATIDDKDLRKLVETSEFIMCDALEDSILANENCLEVDLDFGTLFIVFDSGTLRFKFRPSAKFEEELISTVVDKKNCLKLELETSLSKKLIQTYKDLM